MIGIYVILLLAMVLVVRFCKKTLKIVLGIIIALITIYCVILNIDMNMVKSYREPIFAKENGHMGSMIRYDGLGYKVGLEKNKYSDIISGKLTICDWYLVIVNRQIDYVEPSENDISTDENIEAKDYVLSFYDRSNLEITEIFKCVDYSVKTFGGELNIVVEKDMIYSFKDAIEKNIISVQQILDNAKKDVEEGNIKSETFIDGGSIEYYYDNYTILKLNTVSGDRDLIIGKKGSIINEYNLAVFNNKIKSSGYPIELKVDKNSISSKGAKFTIINTFDEEYHYGADYRIDKKINNEWKKVETEYPLAWKELAYILRANSSNEINIDWSIGYGELEAGEYRVAKKVFKTSDSNDNREIYAEFEIK